MASMMDLLDAPYVFELDVYPTRDQLPQTLQLGNFHIPKALEKIVLRL
jgi:hypothetical protein